MCLVEDLEASKRLICTSCQLRAYPPYLQGCECTLLADRGLSCLELIHQCQQMGWHYVLRIKQEEWFRKKYRQHFHDWLQFKHFIKKEGEEWYGEVILWKEHEFRT